MRGRGEGLGAGFGGALGRGRPGRRGGRGAAGLAAALATALGVAGVAGVPGCRSLDNDEVPGEPVPSRSLYERMGGEATIAAVSEELTELVLEDRRVDFARAGTGAPVQWRPTTENIRQFEEGFAAFLSEITGGPRVYRGPGMGEAHRGMRITDAEFQAFKEDLRAALSASGVPAPESRELLRLIEDYRGEIVEAGPLGRPEQRVFRTRTPM